jgi:hypothetical protein
MGLRHGIYILLILYKVFTWICVVCLTIRNKVIDRNLSIYLNFFKQKFFCNLCFIVEVALRFHNEASPQINILSLI